MKPTKHLILLFLLSLIVVIFKTQLIYVVSWLTSLYFDLVTGLAYIFSMGQIGVILQKAVALFLIPLIIAGVVSGVYYVFRKKHLSKIPMVAWAFWLVLMTIVLLR